MGEFDMGVKSFLLLNENSTLWDRSIGLQFPAFRDLFKGIPEILCF